MMMPDFAIAPLTRNASPPAPKKTLRIAVLSDARIPTHKNYAGHGLGQMCVTIAEGLQKAGHEVALWGAKGSYADVTRVGIWDDETRWNGNAADYDVILDSTHEHSLQQRINNKPIVNLSQDREAAAGKCAVYSSQAHKDWHIQHYQAKRSGRVILNAIEVPELPSVKRQNFYVFLSNLFPGKGLIAAWNAARLAGVRLVIAGQTFPGAVLPSGAEYVGIVSGVDKWELLASAKALIFPSAIECAPVTVLEAMAVNTPAIVSAYGGAKENIKPLATGLAARDTEEIAEAITCIETGYKFASGRDWLEKERPIDKMIASYEQALWDAAKGEVW